MTAYRLLPAGDTGLTVEFGETIDRSLSTRVLALARRIRAAKIAGISDCVPTFRSLTVYYDPLVLSYPALADHVGELLAIPSAGDAVARRWRLPVCYDESLAPDLAEVAARTGLTPAQVGERHSAGTYHVYMLGFLPGQPYLGDLAPDLVLPRRSSPRSAIAAGSIGIAMAMTCIFPRRTPCGWHLIGRCPQPLWNLQGGAAEPLLQPGDTVAFAPVSLREFERLTVLAAEQPDFVCADPAAREIAA